MTDKMYEMFSIDGFKYRKKMNNKIMWEEMESDENSPYWVVERRQRERYDKERENKYASKINKIEKLRAMGFEYV